MKGKHILITGGTGSFGKEFVKYTLDHLSPKSVRIFSRDELKQYEMRKQFTDPRVRFFIGDIRDRDRVYRAFKGVDIVIHAAAMKQVEASEYNPFEAVKTNVIGTQNVIEAAIDCGVERLVSVSSDKAVNPVNLYGATKLCQEKLTVQGNAYAGSRATKLACVRYGNVAGSRGSVIPLFREQAKLGTVTVTDTRMTRFWITLPEAVRFVHQALEDMQGGEIFIPKLPSVRVKELAKAVAPSSNILITGIRPGEKLHEVMITEDEARHTLDQGSRFVVLPEFPFRAKMDISGTELSNGFRYSSDSNMEWLDAEALKAIIDAL